MPLESLLLTRDTDVIQILQHTLSKLSIDVEICRGARSGTEILLSEKFDAVIVDCDDLQDGLGVLKELRKSPSNRTSIAFAIVNGATTTHQAFELGATFVMQKPLTALNAMRCLSAGLGLMVREQRRYFRYVVELEVIFHFAHNSEVRAHTTNISEGGMAIRAVAPLTRGDSGTLTLTLPNSRGIFEAKAELVWVDGDGRAGVRFTELSEEPRRILNKWLEEEILRVDPLPESKRYAH
ncbi:MAG TPA: PilZ domain-containing protein [Terriglobales bacterium]|nr:PilZ domain-containing protein [Terriglobales bacterium]